MRIGIDVRCFAEGRRSGVEEYVEGLLKELFRMDRENEYFLFFNAWNKEAPDFSWATRYPNVTLRTFRIPNKLLNLSLWYFNWPKLDLMIGGVDVFFLPNIAFAAISRRAKLIVTAHDLSFEAYPETFSWKRRLWHVFIYPRRLFRRADRIIAVSFSTKDDLISYYCIPRRKIAVILSGISERFRPMDRNNPKLLQIKEKYMLPYRFILYLGAFEPRKNIVGIIQAYNALRATGHPELGRFALVLAGVSGWKDRLIREEIKSSPYRSDILLPGFIDDVDKPGLYGLASVFVYPSFYEGFGFPPLEAMSCGVPVVTSHSSSLPEIVGDTGILIDPYKPDEIFRAFESILLDRRFRETLRNRGLARVKMFSWQRAARETLKVFREN